LSKVASLKINKKSNLKFIKNLRIRELENLFFELLRVAVGQQVCLSHTPTDNEWRELYVMAEKQAVLGICFRGIERLHEKRQTPPQNVLFEWIGAVEFIKQKNALLNRRCWELQKKLEGSGIKSSILKGQGIASYYGELASLRQPGDIDIYVDCGLKGALQFAKSVGCKDVEWDYKHLHLDLFPDAEVEVHYRVEVLLNLRKNRRLQRWFKEHQDVVQGSWTSQATKSSARFKIKDGEIVTPSVEFNVFYILLHIYRHFLYEGVGLRQIVDYYMVLRKVQELKSLMVQEYVDAVGEFGMERFARGLMWVMQEVLGMPKTWVLWEADEKEGRHILEQVMAGGNFGHYDERLSHGKGKMGAVLAILKHNAHLLGHYPADTLWAPVWVVWHKCWKWSRKK